MTKHWKITGVGRKVSFNPESVSSVIETTQGNITEVLLTNGVLYTLDAEFEDVVYHLLTKKDDKNGPPHS
jgi:hypothetical protein